MRVLLDCDGILADYCQACFDMIKPVTGVTHTLDQVTHWDLFDVLGYAEMLPVFRSLQEERGWCSSFPVYAGAQDAVKALQEKHEVVIVTSPMTAPTWTYERTQWLKQHFGIPKDRIIHTAGKHYVEGDVLVDDSVDHCRSWKAAHPHGMALLWDRPYNQEPPTSLVSRVSSWRDVDAHLESLVRWRSSIKSEGWG